jgi:alpha-glucoside transport system permease protein
VVGGILLLLDLVPRLWARLFPVDAGAPAPGRAGPPPPPTAAGVGPAGSAAAVGPEPAAAAERSGSAVGTLAPPEARDTTAPPEARDTTAPPEARDTTATGGPPGVPPHRPARRRRRRRQPREVWIALAFLAPAGVLLGAGLVVPVFRTIYLSFQDGGGRAFVGLDNYGWMFTQPAIVGVLTNTLIWVILAPLLATTIGLLYAILVDRVKVEAFAKALIFLPMAISFVGASIIWKFVYEFRPEGSDQIGLLNQVLVWLGFVPQNFRLVQAFSLNTLLLIVIMIWIYTGFAMVLLSAAIKAIPAEIVEAARMDGTNPWQMFSRITLPSIKPSVIVVVVTISIATLKVFDIVRTMTGGAFGTSVIANEMYVQAFTQGQLGRGSALASFLFLLVLPLVVYQVYVLRQRRLEAR